jgi:hypothetical protein
MLDNADSDHYDSDKLERVNKHKGKHKMTHTLYRVTPNNDDIAPMYFRSRLEANFMSGQILFNYLVDSIIDRIECTDDEFNGIEEEIADFYNGSCEVEQ